MVGLGLSSKNSGRDLDRKIWQCAHLLRPLELWVFVIVATCWQQRARNFSSHQWRARNCDVTSIAQQALGAALPHRDWEPIYQLPRIFLFQANTTACFVKKRSGKVSADTETTSKASAQISSVAVNFSEEPLAYQIALVLLGRMLCCGRGDG